MYIIIHGEEQNRKRLKGKTITEFAKNLESEGWPSEVTSEERDRIKFEEKSKRRPLQREDAFRIQQTMGTATNKKYIERLAGKLKLTKFKRDFPEK